MELLSITILKDGEPHYILVHLQHICSISLDSDNHTILRLSNGDELVCTDPPYEQWENDSLIS